MQGVRLTGWGEITAGYARILPVAPTDQEIENFRYLKNNPSRPWQPGAMDSCIAFNAFVFTKAVTTATPIQALGHSMKAVSLPKNQSLVYDFECPWEGEALLKVAVIPTQPNDQGDIQFRVRLDDGNPQICSYSESWKLNVLRGQAIRQTKQYMTKGKHTLVLTALDDHVVIDQWMLDFKPNRRFYLFPTTLIQETVYLRVKLISFLKRSGRAL